MPVKIIVPKEKSRKTDCSVCRKYRETNDQSVNEDR